MSRHPFAARTEKEMLEAIDRVEGGLEAAVAVAHAHGMTLHRVLQRDRRPSTVAARRALIAHLDARGMSAAAIGRALGMDHTSVLHHLHKRAS